MNNVLMSIRPQHVNNILNGAKTVELRRRAVSISAGTRIWVYCTLPVGLIQLVVTARKIYIDTPKSIWKKYANEMCIDGDEFFRYTSGASFVSAISLSLIHKLENPISLDSFRIQFAQRNPPQSYCYLHDSPLLKSLQNISTSPIKLSQPCMYYDSVA